MADNSLKDLQEMKKLTSSMMKDYDNLLIGHGKVNKKLKEQVDIQKNIIAGIKDAKTAEEAIIKLKAKYNGLSTKQIDNNKNIIVALQMQNRIARQFIEASALLVRNEEKRKQILNDVKGKVDGVAGKMKEQISSLKHELEHIPVVGKLMEKAIPFDKITGGIDRMGRAFTGGFTGGFNKSFKATGNTMKSVIAGMRGGIAGMGTAIARLGPMLMGPQAIIAGIVAVLGLGLIRMHQIEEAANKFKQSTGLLNSQMGGVQRQISSVSAELRQIGVSMDDVAGYAADFYNTFNGTQKASDAVLKSMGVLEKNLGVSVESQTKLNKLFQSATGASQEQAQYMVASTAEAARLAGIAPDKVLKDMSENSESMYRYFRGSVKEMQSAAIQAAKMGTSIGEMSKVSETLLNFETSLTDELQASAILGKSLNLSIARSKFATKDLVGGYDAVLDAVSKIGSIQDMSPWQQDAITKATGMTVEQLAQGQLFKQKFANADRDALAAAMDYIKAGKDINDLTEDNLKTLVKEQKTRKEMQGQIHALGDMVKGFGGIVMDAFLPIGQAFIKILTPIVSALGSFIKGFVTPFASAFKRVGDSVEKLFSRFGGMEKSGKTLGKIFEFIGTLFSGTLVFGVEMLLGGFNAVMDIITGVVSILKGIFTGDLQMIGDGIKDVFSGLIGWFARIPIALYRAFVDMFPAIGEALSSWWDGIVSWIGSSLKGILPDWALKLIGGTSSGGGNSAEATESVNDGVIQKGKVISTNPADTLIATKSPGELFQKVMGASPLGMLASGISNLVGGGQTGDLAPLIAEIQGLRADLNSGKIAVNMDGRKVTSGITKISGQAGANSYVQR